MKLNQLNAFLAVTEHATIRGAARALGVTQPAVTKVMRELELDFGVPLITRSVKGIELTEYGRAFEVRARLLVAEMRRTRDEMEQIKRGTTGSVSISVSPTVAFTILPAAFDAFTRSLPDATVSFSEGSNTFGFAKLRDGTLDFIVTHLLEEPDETSGEFTCIPLFRTVFVVGARSRHPRVRARSLREIHDEQWCMPLYGVGGDDLTRSIFQPNGMTRPKRIVRCPSFSVALGLVAHTNVLSVFARPLVDIEFKRHGIKALTLQEPLPELTVAIIVRRGARLTPAALHFIDCLTDASAKFEAEQHALLR
ncbi:LysR substrate-binding domain-containing protein [Paraburkholderia caffeinilytica]|uniref:LysR substrate-binding domain-containing protein n=1 Tax=Paraburkholderia caffeinilytica TaxID=1761016 RepID=UPI0038B9D11D